MKKKEIWIKMKRNEDKIRVLHFTIANTGGGVTQFVLNLWKNIDRTKFHFDFVTMSSHLDFAEELEREGCKIYYVTTYAEDDKVQFTKEIEAILDNGYDVVHLHTNWWRGFLLEEIAKRKGVGKIIIHSHNTDVHIKENQSREEARQLHREQRELLNEDMATDYLACSWKAAEWLYGDRIPRERIWIVPNAVDTKKYVFDAKVRDEYRKKLDVTDKYVIGHVGRFAYQKNHEFLIEVFEEVCKEIENAVLLLVGIGELEDEIRKKIEDAGLKEKVFFAGKRNDVHCLMQAMDLFVLPSRFEGLPIVLIEAQAAGLRCLVSNEVSMETKVTQRIEYLPLEKEVWIKRIEQNCGNNEKRDDCIYKICEAGFDKTRQSKLLEVIYQKRIRA